MKYNDLRLKIKTNVFSLLDVQKLFPLEKSSSIQIQLSRLVKKKLIHQIKRGVYYQDSNLIDPFGLSNYLYSPSYVSLESALFFYGIIPDVPQNITAVTITTSKKIDNELGKFYYSKIKSDLFFGSTKINSPVGDAYFAIAHKEKALLDYFYIRKIKTIDDLRLDLKSINRKIYQKYLQYYPKWVQNITIKKTLT